MNPGDAIQAVLTLWTRLGASGEHPAVTIVLDCMELRLLGIQP